ncbi:cytidine deaminase [Microbacterium sp. 18062]|uniref:cytidine deaminase n=1 Tax=Microbacterium sp. 18062 TaxID=2681410 RepID=UPI00135B0239|nr:cytidine deaminase [Microbacterium sp. 18062]
MSDRPSLARPAGMDDADAELLTRARDLLDAVYREGRHEVVAAFRLSDGAIVTGVHVDGSARRSAVCAEGVAAGNAIAQGASAPVVAAVSVLRRPGGTWHLIEPCGVCAEMLSDYWPDARVWVTAGSEGVPTTFAGLLPAKRRRVW